MSAPATNPGAGDQPISPRGWTTATSADYLARLSFFSLDEAQGTAVVPALCTAKEMPLKTAVLTRAPMTPVSAKRPSPGRAVPILIMPLGEHSGLMFPPAYPAQ